jgi:hypothetical protein
MEPVRPQEMSITGELIIDVANRAVSRRVVVLDPQLIVPNLQLIVSVRPCTVIAGVRHPQTDHNILVLVVDLLSTPGSIFQDIRGLNLSLGLHQDLVRHTNKIERLLEAKSSMLKIRFAQQFIPMSLIATQRSLPLMTKRLI